MEQYEVKTVRGETFVIKVYANSDGTFYAVHGKLGCGKDARTAIDALARLYQDHGHSASEITKLG